MGFIILQSITNNPQPKPVSSKTILFENVLIFWAISLHNRESSPPKHSQQNIQNTDDLKLEYSKLPQVLSVLYLFKIK